MRKVLFAGIALFATACAASIHGLIPIGQAQPAIQRDIVEQQIRIWRLNENVSDERISPILDDPERLRKFRSMISKRYASDFASIHRMERRKASGEYLLLARRSGGYLVYVIRVADVTPDGKYTSLPGLIYTFDPLGRFINVTSTDY